MNEKEFLLWFKGYSDSIGVAGPSSSQWSKIQHEAALAFNKVVPYMPNTNPSTETYCGAIPMHTIPPVENPPLFITC